MAFHCGAPTRDGSPCQRHVRDLGTRCPQHRNLGGPALHPPRHAMRTIELADPALTAATTAWISARADLAARAGALRDRVTPRPQEASKDAGAGSEMTKDAAPTGPVGSQSYLDRERSRRIRAAGEGRAEVNGEQETEGEAVQAEPVAEPERDAGEPSAPLSYLDRERARRRQPLNGVEAAPKRDAAEPKRDVAEPLSALSYLARQRAAREAEQDSVSEPRPVEQRPQLRKERALDPDWIGARPLFRDEAPTRPTPKIEFEPSDAGPPLKPPRVPSMRSVVLNPPSDTPQPAVTPNGFAAEPDPPTLIDRIPPIGHDDLVVPDFLRPDFGAPAAAPEPKDTRPPLPQRRRRPRPVPQADPDPPTLIDPHPPVPAAPVLPAPLAATAAPDEISVPDFVVPGFTQPAPKPPLRTVLSTVLGADLWQRCYAEWSPAHCTALARIARAVDGLAPSAGTAMRSTAGAGMRWLGVAREREMLADQVAGAISHPAGATAANQARTVRLYGAAICTALNVPLRRCACHRDLERDVSGELIRLGLEELAGEVP